VAIGGVIYGGDTSRTTSQTNDCGTSLAAQSICTLSVQISSLNQNIQNGTLSVITSAASGTTTMAIQVAALLPPWESFSPTPISFGDWAVGVMSPPVTTYNGLTISSSDSYSLEGSFVGPNASDFSLVKSDFIRWVPTVASVPAVRLVLPSPLEDRGCVQPRCRLRWAIFQ